MEYSCSVCQQKVKGDMMVFMDHTQQHIVDLIKHDHPEWVENDGACQKCVDYYHAELNGSTFKDAPCAIRKRKMSSFFERLRGLFTGGKT